MDDEPPTLPPAEFVALNLFEARRLRGWTQQEAADRTTQLIEEHSLRTVRMIWVDQHGVPRCKFMSTADYLASLGNGIDFSAALLSMDSANNVFTPLFVEGGGFDIPELTGFPVGQVASSASVICSSYALLDESAF